MTGFLSLPFYRFLSSFVFLLWLNITCRFVLCFQAFLSQALGPVLAIGDVSGSIFICAAVSFFFTV